MYHIRAAVKGTAKEDEDSFCYSTNPGETHTGHNRPLCQRQIFIKYKTTFIQKSIKIRQINFQHPEAPASRSRYSGISVNMDVCVFLCTVLLL